MRSGIASLFTVILLAAVAGLAQTTATIVGTVTDPSGAVVPNVAITVVQTDTGLTRKVQTNTSGNYVAPLLPVGRYSVSAEIQGFKKKVVSGIVLHVNQEPRVKHHAGYRPGDRIGERHRQRHAVTV